MRSLYNQRKIAGWKGKSWSEFILLTSYTFYRANPLSGSQNETDVKVSGIKQSINKVIKNK